jgi:hypothetical protein
MKQKRKCYTCNNKLKIKDTYINKLDHNKPFSDNIYLSCFACYSTREDDFIDDL